MKKIFAIALALVMVLGIATSAMAISWGAPTTSSSSSPFAAEVIKLGANSGVTGTEYYSVLNDAAAYDYSNIFYAIKLTIPSASQANAAYSGAKYNVGDEIKVTISYTNVSGKSSDTKYVKIGASAKTLWYNGKTGVFEESWVPSVSNACGCGDQHVIKATASGNKEVKVKVCFSAKGKLKDIKIAGCYGVEKKEYCGIKPCVNCKPVDLNGFKFSGDCAKFPVFFSTNSAGKVTGVYVIDGCNATYTTDAYGSMKQITKALYGWQATGTDCGECTTCTNGTATKFELVQLDKGTVLTNGWTTWDNQSTIGSLTAAETEARFNGSCGYLGSTVYGAFEKGAKIDMPINSTNRANAYDMVYIQRDDGNFTPMTASLYGKLADDLSAGDKLYKNSKSGTYTDAIALSGTDTNVESLNGVKLPAARDDGRFLPNATTGKEKDWSVYKDWTANVVYLETYFFCFEDQVEQLFQQLTADKVSCDTNDATYLNSINHLYSVLGFTYADVAAGNVYMTEDILLANFGFAIAPCSEAVWGAYTAAITVAAVAEVPATGSMTYAGFAMIVLAIAAAVATKKVRA
ncbi:MAG: hypothetical protein Q4E65_06045 [Clostridia bacterium]|nr:hypothetical protein [Clostridia bacterium]